MRIKARIKTRIKAAIDLLTEHSYSVTRKPDVISVPMFQVIRPDGVLLSKGCTGTNVVQMAKVLEYCIAAFLTDRRTQSDEASDLKAATLLRSQAKILWESYSHNGEWPEEGFEAELKQYEALTEAARKLEL